MFIGNRLKELRKSNKISLTELSQKSGVQLATLSRIENLKMVGSLDSHMKIAKAFGIDITQLYSDISRGEAKVELRTPKSTSDVFVHNERSTFQILTNKVLGKKMMPILLKIEPNGKANPEQNQTGSEKFVFVVEGQIKVQVAEETFPLSRYNTLYFDSSLPYSFVNTGKKTAKILCVGTPVAL